MRQGLFCVVLVLLKVFAIAAVAIDAHMQRLHDNDNTLVLVHAAACGCVIVIRHASPADGHG